jgi:alpha-beta hydrolase superfamily lysophospholipase
MEQPADMTVGTPLTKRLMEERSFLAHDKVQLFYRHWPAVSQEHRGAVLLFHRGHEHSARMAHVVDELDLPDFAFFAWDARGNGRSAGERGFSPSLGTSVRDVQTFIEHIQAEHGFAEEDLAVVAQSVGAVLIATWAHDYAPRIRCMVLASPAFKVKLYVPFARPGLRLMQKLRGNFFVNSYVKARYLSHDPARIASYNSDPLITRPISVNILLALYEVAQRIVDDAGAIVVPTQLLISGADWVVHHRPQHLFYERLGSPIKEKHVFAGFFHDTLGEKDRALALEKARHFILQRFNSPWQRPDLTHAHLQGYTSQEAARLAEPLPALSPRGLFWMLTRLSLKFPGKLSGGVRLGHETGFDSGSTLDYVYRNQPTGSTFLGRLLDRSYLNAIGWRGIRQRKVHAEELIRLAAERLRAAKQPVHVLDIAAGHGRYVLEAFERGAIQQPDTLILRDYSDINVQAGTALITAKGMAAFARFVRADAFDADSIAATEPRPTLCIVSGLYELFPDNELVGRSLSGLARAIPVGGYLVYTGQPWHPQLEFIARALTSHRKGAAWVMRRRTQEEMDQLVRAAGFRKISQRIDEWGIFTVSLAQRVQ